MALAAASLVAAVAVAAEVAGKADAMILHYDEQGSGPVIVLLHGIAGSRRYWQPLLPFITAKHRVIAIDLLGYGRSPMPKNVTYDYPTHLASIIETLDHGGVTQPFTLLGHSMGALLALRLAAMHPDRISKLVLMCMPIYADVATAHRAITGSSRLKELMLYGWTSRLLCNAWCRLARPLTSRLAPLYLPHISREAAQDSVLHTWQSYDQSRHYLIERQAVAADLAQIRSKIIMIYGDNETPDCLDGLQIHPKQLAVHVLPGKHHLLAHHSAAIAQFIND